MSRASGRATGKGGSVEGAQDAILDAAEQVVIGEGMGRLTLDAVARRIGRSKAGVLHHFPSKSALVEAMVRRLVTMWFTEYKRAYDAMKASGDRIPAVRTMLSTCLSGTHAWTEAERARNRVMVAALVHDERHVEPLIRIDRDLTAMLRKDALKPGVAEVMHLAMHGLWFQWIFGMGSVTESRLRVIRGVLEDLMKANAEAGESGAGRGKGPQRRKRGVR